MKYFLRRVPQASQASQAKHKRKARRERARQPHKFKEAKELKHIRQGADEMSSPNKLGSLRSYDGCFLNSLLFLNSPLSPQLQNTKASGILVVMWKSSRTIIISNVFKLEWGLYATESQQTTITIIIPFSSQRWTILQDKFSCSIYDFHFYCFSLNFLSYIFREHF